MQNITDPLIKEQKLIKKQEAYKMVYPEAAVFEEDENLRAENADAVMDMQQFKDEWFTDEQVRRPQEKLSRMSREQQK